MIVADASAITELLLQTELGSRVEKRLFREYEDIHAPHLLDIEVVSALRRLVRRREVFPGRAERALESCDCFASFVTATSIFWIESGGCATT